MNYYIYILSNKSNVAIYTGVTNNLVRRVYQHKANLYPKSFTARYGIHKLVYYEVYNDIHFAINREKQIKSWSRSKKNDLINSLNPGWNDLYDFARGVPGAIGPAKAKGIAQQDR